MSHLRIFGDSFWHVFIETHNPESVFQKNRTPHTHIPMFKKKSFAASLLSLVVSVLLFLYQMAPWPSSCCFGSWWLFSFFLGDSERISSHGWTRPTALGSAAGNRSSVLQARTLSQAEPEAGGESIHVPQCQIHCGCRAEQDLQSPAVSKVSSLRSKTSKEKVKLDSCLLCT